MLASRPSFGSAVQKTRFLPLGPVNGGLGLQVYRLDWLRWSRSTGIRLVYERVAEGERPELYARVVNQLEAGRGRAARSRCRSWSASWTRGRPGRASVRPPRRGGPAPLLLDEAHPVAFGVGKDREADPARDLRGRVDRATA